ncbi:MAG: hypothetical protein R3B84_13125 [Zavarzinella sp.]
MAEQATQVLEQTHFGLSLQQIAQSAHISEHFKQVSTQVGFSAARTVVPKEARMNVETINAIAFMRFSSFVS